MSEINKARKFNIVSTYIPGMELVRYAIESYDAWDNKKEEERFKVIELAPMLKMMDEMAEAISNWKIQVETYGGDYLPGNYKQLITALESYQAFKRENGLE